MTTLTIEDLAATYHLAPRARHQRFALDRALRAVVDRHLSTALDALELGDQVVCIRQVDAPVRLDPSASEDTWARAWAQAIAAQIRVGRQRPSPNVVVYARRSAVVLDAILSVLAGRTERAWAWRQCGVVRTDTTDDTMLLLESALHTLVAAPRTIVPMLVALARHEALRPLLLVTPPRVWSTLAVQAWRAHGGGAVELAPPATLAEHTAAAVLDAVETRSRLWRVFRTLIAEHASKIEAHEGIVLITSLARLALLEVDASIATVPPRARHAITRLTQAATEAAAQHETSPAIDAAEPPGAERARLVEEAERLLTPSEPREAWTEEGGLLFLLRPLAMLGFPERAASDEITRDRPLAEVLHHFARRFRGLAPDDPAALAFAGLHPEAQPPTDLPPDDALAGWLDEQAVRLTAWVEDVLADEPIADRVAWVCRRRAQVVAEPGWIELRFSLESVSTALRRIGLDVDPDWVPWLGAVVRFVYV